MKLTLDMCTSSTLVPRPAPTRFHLTAVSGGRPGNEATPLVPLPQSLGILLTLGEGGKGRWGGGVGKGDGEGEKGRCEGGGGKESGKGEGGEGLQ